LDGIEASIDSVASSQLSVFLGVSTRVPRVVFLPLQMRFVRGVGGSDQKTLRVQLGELPWVECGGVRFERVRALYAVQGGMDVSLYSAGIVCGDLLSRTDIVLDYVNQQIGLRRPVAAL